jgi:hypothetical protein
LGKDHTFAKLGRFYPFKAPDIGSSEGKPAAKHWIADGKRLKDVSGLGADAILIDDGENSLTILTALLGFFLPEVTQF